MAENHSTIDVTPVDSSRERIHQENGSQSPHTAAQPAPSSFVVDETRARGPKSVVSGFVRILIGIVCVLIGIPMLILPGPGLLAIAVGLVLIGSGVGSFFRRSRTT